MAEFALGSIATLGSNNPPATIHGSLPRLGSHVDVNWAFAIALLVCIAGVHTVLSLLAFRARSWNEAHLLSQNEVYEGRELPRRGKGEDTLSLHSPLTNSPNHSNEQSTQNA